VSLDPLQMLRERQGGRSLRAFAREIGVSPMYLSDLYHGRREPGPTILSYLQLEKVVTRSIEYRRNRQR
jgi:transcriptional regulator with XRE-family HTH domain